MNVDPAPGAPSSVRALRAAVVLLAAVAAIGPGWSLPSGAREEALLVVDVSESVTAGAASYGGDERLVFADGVRRVLPGEEASNLPRGRTRTADALREAFAAVEGTTRDVVLVTDGRDTEGGVAEVVARGRAAGHRLHTAPPTPVPADVGLDAARVVAADAVRGVVVEARIVASGPGRVRVSLWRGSVEADATPVEVRHGLPASVRLTDREPLRRATGYEVRLEPLDGTPDDDAGDDHVELLAAPSEPTIVVLDDVAWPAPADAASPWVDGLRAGRAFVDGADVIVLADQPWARLGEPTAARLASVVASGATLVVLGGASSYASGGWPGTAFERLLPLRSTAPDGGETAVVVALDRSGSTAEVPPDGGPPALDALRRAVRALAEATSPDVRVGVLPFAAVPDAEPLAPGWVRGGDDVARATLVASLAALRGAGGTDLDAAVEAAARRAAPPGVRRRRVILATDGDPDHALGAASFPRAREALARGDVAFSAVVRGDVAAAAALRSLAASPDDVALVDAAGAFPDAVLAAFHRARGRDELARAAGRVAALDADVAPLEATVPTAFHRLELAEGATLLATVEAPHDVARPFAAVRRVGAGSVIALAWGPSLEAGDAADVARRTLRPLVATWAARVDRGLVADEADGRVVARAAAGAGELRARRAGSDAPTRLLEVAPGRYEGPAPAGREGAPIELAVGASAWRPVRASARPPAESRGAGVDEALLAAWAAEGGGRRLAPGERPPAVAARRRIAFGPWSAVLAVALFVVERASVARRRTPRSS